MFRLHQVIYENPQHVPNNVETTTIFLSSLNYERLLINPHSFKHHKNNQEINNPTQRDSDQATAHSWGKHCRHHWCVTVDKPQGFRYHNWHKWHELSKLPSHIQGPDHHSHAHTHMHTHQTCHSRHHRGLTLASARHQRIPSNLSQWVCIQEDNN